MTKKLFQCLTDVMITTYICVRNRKKEHIYETDPLHVAFRTVNYATPYANLVGRIYAHLVASKFNKPIEPILDYLAKQRDEAYFMENWGIDEDQAHYRESIIPKVSDVPTDKKILVEHLNKLVEYEIDSFSVATVNMKQRLLSGKYHPTENDCVIIAYVEEPSKYDYANNNGNPTCIPARIGQLCVYPDDKIVYIDADNKIISF